MKYRPLKKLNLRNHPEFSEQWLQEIIANDPAILGLGEVTVRDRERRQPRAGRLDLLLEDRERSQRYEVELQLGSTDESHIIRTVEYWDIERKRYPQFEHCAVIVAEEVTSRFLNVISLFNGTIPLIAIQVSAFEIDGEISLLFTKVLVAVSRGPIDDDEDALSAPTDRQYWEKKSAPQIVKLADKVLSELQKLEPSLQLNFNKHYIGLVKNNQAFNFVTFRPKKQRFNLEIKLPRSDEFDELVDEAGFDTLEYNSKWQVYRLSLQPSDLIEQTDALEILYRAAFERRNS
ncbi:DUF5655 domain-containing protein [uncultured Shimia sp.]|uniref:DUF5655 domain-containing protein n=1 Tax=uncultured Shimia sp. TaxID=573152 RepID=UPI0025F73B56|nr:DUF5655 domain-containing protein [uncultured Shimia sp.]